MCFASSFLALFNASITLVMPFMAVTTMHLIFFHFTHHLNILVIFYRIRERKESVTVLLCGTSGCGKSTLSALLVFFITCIIIVLD